MTHLDFSDLEDDFDSIPTTNDTGRFAKTESFPCERCNGKGEVTFGYVNIQRGKCHTCNGKGYFKTSRADRQKAKTQRVERKAKKAEHNSVTWAAQNGELFTYLCEVSSWNGFAKSLIDAISKYGHLTDNQLSSAQRMFDKHVAKEAEKAKAKAAVATIDMSKINALFETAASNGLKRRILRVGSLAISVAPVTGTNAGCLYVKDGGEYAGKITQENKFFGLRTARKEIEAELIELAKDPMAAAKMHGQQTGNCCCCNRELTDPVSIELGIGPICAENWGF
jgi:hypothetical protein